MYMCSPVITCSVQGGHFLTQGSQLEGNLYWAGINFGGHFLGLGYLFGGNLYRAGINLGGHFLRLG